MKSVDGERVAALAARLELAPREVLALAARLAAPGTPLDALRLDAGIAAIRRAPAAAEAAADLALLGYAGYALDDVDHALSLVWIGDDRERGP